MKTERKYVRSRHALLKALTRPFLGFVLNPKSKSAKKPESTNEFRGPQKKNKEKKGNRLFSKIVLRVVTILFLAAILCGGLFFAYKKFTTVKKEINYAMVSKQLSYCQEFVSAKYRYSDIISIKKSAGFSKSYSIVKYSGIIRVGIFDFTEITYDISLDGTKLVIHVPKTEILGNEITKQEVFDEKQSIFVPITTQEIFDEIEKAKIEAAEEMIAEGILEESWEYACQIIKQFMLSLGFEEIEIRTVKARFAQGLDSSVFRVCNKP